MDVKQFTRRDLPTAPRVPLKAHPRLRYNNSLPPSHRDIVLHPLNTPQLALVVSPMCQRSSDDLSGYLGLPVA